MFAGALLEAYADQVFDLGQVIPDIDLFTPDYKESRYRGIVFHSLSGILSDLLTMISRRRPAVHASLVDLPSIYLAH